MRNFALLLAAVTAAAPVTCLAGQTRTWQQSTAADFEKGDLHGLAIRSDGRLTLAPQRRELFDASSAYLWAMASDSKGVLYTGGGPGAKLYRVEGTSYKTIAEFEALEIHALAIDRQDNVYIATSPDGRVYKVAHGAKPVEFYNPKQKYIWSMAFDARGDLFLATGDQGEIHRVTPDGKGSVFFKSDETHIRSLVIAGGQLYAGTDPSGLVLRISATGEGFVLYQMAKHEVTSVVAGPDGSVYAAAAGAQAAVVAAPAPAPAPAAANTATIVLTPASPRPTVSETATAMRPTTYTGGSDVYRIHPDGLPEKLWTSARDVVYAMAFDAQNRLLLGTGNRGLLIRVDSPTRSTTLVNLQSNQILALAAGGQGELFAATGNVGKLFQIGPGLEAQGTWESDVFDSGGFSQWGRTAFYGSPNGGRIALEARSGNLDRPRQNWSPWTAPITSPSGARVTAPPARFLQLRATLTAGRGDSPEMDSAEAAYLLQNVAPLLEEVEITPANYRFGSTTPAPATPRSPAALSLPAIGKHVTPSSSSLDLESSTMTYAKGWLGARWSASDENGDPLSYSVEIRGIHERQWKPLHDQIGDRHYSFDSTAFPDGEYRLRITASDAPGNTAENSLASEIVSPPFTIDNTPPQITGLTATRTAAGLVCRWHAADALNVIKRAEYSLDGGDWKLADPEGRLSDSPALDYTLKIAAQNGEHTLAVRVTDDFDNASTAKVVVP